jgi:hypothetical protein
MHTPYYILYNRISDYFFARVHTKDYVGNQDCSQGSQPNPLELDGTVKQEMVISFLNSRLSSGDNLVL